MCGINGILSNSSIENFENQIISMNKLLNHRGPDYQGHWLSNCKKVGFGHTRLSIIDTSELGNQPMKSSSGRYVITYNGEIYNYRELKKLHNINCISNSDTEVLLELIESIGLENTLQNIDGMFAFALWDNKNKTLNLCRDRFGEKPIYYGWVQDNFVFSSQLDCIKLIPGWKKDISLDALNQFQQFGYVPAPLSIYSNIKKLPPSSNLSVFFSQGRFKEKEIKYFWSIPETNAKADSQKSFNQYLEEFDLLLKKSVKSRMISDVPLGAFLSGGIDSSLVVATMQSLSDKRINTFTIGNKDASYDEAPKAKLISSSLGTNHTELYIDDKEIIDLAPSIYLSFDEPFADSSQIPSYLISKLAKQSVTVALSGDAGDELFAGYKRYLFARDLWSYSSLIPRLPKKYVISLLEKKFIHKLVRDFSPKFLLNRYANSSNRLNKVEKLISLLKKDKLENFYSAILSNTNSENFLNKEMVLPTLSLPNKDEEILLRFMKCDISTYLPNDVLTKVDRSSMAHSLEVRVPLLSKELAEWSLELPLKYKIKGHKQKIFQKKNLEIYLSKELIYTEKKGFSIPLRDWLKGPLKPWAEDTFNSLEFKNSDYWNTEKVAKTWESHKKGLTDASALIWSILNFQNWDKD